MQELMMRPAQRGEITQLVRAAARDRDLMMSLDPASLGATLTGSGIQLCALTLVPAVQCVPSLGQRLTSRHRVTDQAPVELVIDSPWYSPRGGTLSLGL